VDETVNVNDFNQSAWNSTVQNINATTDNLPVDPVTIQNHIVDLTNQIIAAAKANGFIGNYEGLTGDLNAIVAETLEKVNNTLDVVCPAYPFETAEEPVKQYVFENVVVPIPHWVPKITPWEKARMLKTEVRLLRDQLHQCAVSVYESGETWAANYAVRWGENFINKEDIEYWSALARDAVYEQTGTYIEPGQISNDVKNEAWELIGYW